MEKKKALAAMIQEHAERKQLVKTKLALPLAEKLLDTVAGQNFMQEDKGITAYEHGLAVARMLIGLHIDLPKEEEDQMFAATLCQEMLYRPEEVFEEKEVAEQYKIDPEILNILQRIRRPDNMNEKEKKQYYERIQEHKIAVLVVLANHANLVEQLSSFSIADVNGFIHEMKTYLLPICVYAKQHYQDCQMPVHILMEKIRSLIDVTTIIANRYQKREMAYTNEILSLMEENARLRGMIAQFTDLC